MSNWGGQTIGTAMSLRTALCFCVTGLAAPATAADAFSSDWSGGLKSSARLISGEASGGRLQAGVEIKLAPGAITYWRNPGDAGVPPTFSFEGSENVAAAEPLFPAPKRLSEGDGEAFGYDHSVVLPIDVKPADAAKPVTLALKLNYAVCEKICVPARADLQLRLGGSAAPSPYAAAVSQAAAQVPPAVDWASLSGKASLASDGDKTWRLCLQDKPGADLFIDAPAPWWFSAARETSSPAGQSCYRVKLEQKPSDMDLPVTVSFTVTGADAFETAVALGAPAAR
jgi:DsbC/DsbD-like thiol-disulfide interchange protein